MARGPTPGGVNDPSLMGGAEPDERAPTPGLDEDALFLRLKRWFFEDRDHCEKWHAQARDEFALLAGDQWTDEDKARLIEQGRAPIVFNRIAPVIDSVVGQEVANRQEVRFIPRNNTSDPAQGADGPKVELYTEAARWFRDMC